MKTLWTKTNTFVFSAALLFASSITAGVRTTPFLPLVETTSLIHHQQQILGKKKGSVLYQIKNQRRAAETSSHFVYEVVRQSLPNKYKNDAIEIATTIINEARNYDFDPIFVLAIILNESGFDPEKIGSFKEVGLMQIKPSTADWINGKTLKLSNIDLRNPSTNIRIGLAFMNTLKDKFFSNGRLYISAYNMGVKNVNRLLAQNELPKEYIKKVNEHYNRLVDSLDLVIAAQLTGELATIKLAAK